MRILPTVAAVIVAFGLQFSSGFSKDDRPDVETVSELEPTEETRNSVTETDPIVTGKTIASEHLERWKRQSDLYHACPECVANQPYPFPEE